MCNLKQSWAVATRSQIVDDVARLFAMKAYHDAKLEDNFMGAQVTTVPFPIILEARRISVLPSLTATRRND